MNYKCEKCTCSTEDDRITVPVDLDSDLHEKLSTLAEKNGVSVDIIASDLVTKYFQKLIAIEKIEKKHEWFINELYKNKSTKDYKNLINRFDSENQ
jgi:hypothetical protein